MDGLYSLFVRFIVMSRKCVHLWLACIDIFKLLFWNILQISFLMISICLGI